MLVNFYVAAIGFTLDKFLKSALGMFEQAQIPVRVIGMSKPLAQKHEPPVNPVPGKAIADPRGGRYLLPAALHQNLVRIEQKDPLVLKREIGERPVPFFGPTTAILKLYDLRPVILRDSARLVRA